MSQTYDSATPMEDMRLFWWVFAIRGGLAVLFAGMLSFTGSLLGSLFFDPIMIVYLTLLLGFYVLGNGLLLGVAGGFALEHRLLPGWLLLTESAFAVMLGMYIGISLAVTPHSFALLAGLHAFIAGGFQLVMARRLRVDRLYALLLGCSGLFSLSVGVFFLSHRDESLRTLAGWMSAYEVFYGVCVLLLAFGLRRGRVSAILPVAA